MVKKEFSKVKSFDFHLTTTIEIVEDRAVQALYLRSPLCLHGVVLNEAELYFALP
jgi:hypothetical protein